MVCAGSSHAIGGGSNPGEGWDALSGEAALPFVPVERVSWPLQYGIVARALHAGRIVLGSNPGGLEMRRFHVIVYDYLHNI